MDLKYNKQEAETLRNYDARLLMQKIPKKNLGESKTTDARCGKKDIERVLRSSKLLVNSIFPIQY